MIPGNWFWFSFYSVTARQLLELQKVDVLELCVLIEMVAQDFIHTFNRQTGIKQLPVIIFNISLF